MSLENIYKIVQELKSTSGRIDKENILKREIDNEEWKQFLKYVLDPHLVYGLQKKKISKFLQATTEENSDNLFDVFEYLLSNSTGKDKDAEYVASFINNQPEQYHEFLLESITKSLRMGIDSTVNKIYGKGFISKFDVMLAKDFYKESHKLNGADFILTEKLDGARAVLIVKDGHVKAFSRQGKPILDLIEIEQEMSRFPDGVYDGELLIKDEHLYKDREVLQETLKISRKDQEKTGLNFWLFDCLTIEEFESGESEDTYAIRRAKLDALMDDLLPLEHARLLPVLYVGNGLGVIPDMLAELEAEGKEGLMLNTATGKYQCKRSSNLLKIKSMATMDVLCTGIFEGEGRLQGKLGGIIVDYKGYPLRVGSGFSDQERELYFNNPSLITDRVIEVQYFRESSNADGGLSVSFPVFKMIREDGKEVSYH